MPVKFAVIEKVHASMNPCGKLCWKFQEGEGGGREESVRVNWNFVRGGTGSWNNIIRKCNIAVTTVKKVHGNSLAPSLLQNMIVTSETISDSAECYAGL